MTETQTGTHRCRTHGIEYPADTRVVAGIEIQVGGCPECLAEKRRRLSAVRDDEEERARLNRACRIEPGFEAATLESYRAVTPAQKRALRAARRLIQGKIKALLLLGPNGTGKTHLAVSAVREMRGQVWSMYEITTRIRATYTPRATETELDVVDRLTRVPLLGIDEIGRTRGSEAEANWLSYVIDKRYSRGLPLMVMSNNHQRSICPQGGCARCIENYLGADIASRLADGGLTVRLDGEDYRRRGIRSHGDGK